LKHKQFRDIAKTVKSEEMRAVYEILAQKEPTFVSDSLLPVRLSTSEINEIQSHLYGQVKANMVQDGATYMSLSEYKNKFESYVRDGFTNPYTGIGVRGVDPTMWNQAYTPVSMSPNEATSYYASGGTPAIIIDKKSQGALINGYTFEAEFMPEVDRLKLRDYAKSVGFDQAIAAGTRDGLIYGGSIAYPHFKKDTSDTMCLPLNQLQRDQVLEKDCIDYFVVADRWNCITVPNYDITARDYLTPDTFFIPIGGIRLATARCAVIRPRKLPYWGALRNIGWSTSDFEGYIQSLMAYKIVMASVPIMAQQMSLLVHEIPLDGMMAQMGVSGAQEFVNKNSEMLRNWSMANPLTINSYGELKAINRTFTDFSNLIQALRQDASSNAGFPESVLFHTQSTGFNDNVEDITLKQSETIKGVNNAVTPSLKPLIKMLVISCFGADSPYALKCDQVRINFDSPVVVTNEQKGTLFSKFTQGVAQLASAGLELGDAVAIAQSFIPDVKIPDDIIQRVKDTEKPAPKLPPEFLNGGKEGEAGEDGDKKAPFKAKKEEANGEAQ
jgi:hypothetical protein